jgi:hypothetical protein
MNSALDIEVPALALAVTAPAPTRINGACLEIIAAVIACTLTGDLGTARQAVAIAWSAAIAVRRGWATLIY